MVLWRVTQIHDAFKAFFTSLSPLTEPYDVIDVFLQRHHDHLTRYHVPVYHNPIF